MGLCSAKATRDFGEIPNWFDGSLGTNGLTRRKQNCAIGHQATGFHAFPAFGKVNVGFGDSNSRTNVPVIQKSENTNPNTKLEIRRLNDTNLTRCQEKAAWCCSWNLPSLLEPVFVCLGGQVAKRIQCYTTELKRNTTTTIFCRKYELVVSISFRLEFHCKPNTYLRSSWGPTKMGKVQS